MKIFQHNNPVFYNAGHIRDVEIQTGDSVSMMLAKLGLDPELSIVVVNNNEVSDDHLLDAGDVVHIKILAAGGDTTSTLSIIASVALIVAAPYLAPLLLPGVSVGVASGLIIAGGTLLIQAFVASQQVKPKAFTSSPTYDLSGGRNAIRLGEAIPIVCGTHKVVPDLDAKPYTSFVDNDSYLYQVFTVGIGDMTISDIKIGDDVIGNYSDVTTEVSSNDGLITLFPQNVDSVAGGDMPRYGDVFIRTSSTDTTRLEVDFRYVSYTTDSKSRTASYHGYVQIEYRAVGGPTWLPFVDGEVHTVLLGDSTELRRKTIGRDVASGQYEVRVTRITKTTGFERSLPKRTFNVTFSALRSFQTVSDGDYYYRKRIGLRIRANSQLQGVVDQFNCVATAYTQVWNGSTFVLQATSNPAWWYLHFARGKYHATTGLLMYGAGLSDVDIDLDTIKAWGAWCDAKSLSFNYVFDRQMSVDECLSIIARAGRASPSHHTGKLGVVYDNDAAPVAYNFNMGNIIKDSFSVAYISEKLVDRVEVEFINSANDYKPDVVASNMPGVTTPTNPVRLRIEGVTSETQAGEEANLIAAEQFYRAKRVSFDTDIEGLLVSRGDVVTLSHDLTSWDESGRLDPEGTHTTTSLTLMESVTVGATNKYISLRYTDGTIEIKEVVANVSPSNVITLTTATSQDVNTLGPENIIYQLGAAATPGKRYKIISLTPQGDGKLVNILAVEDNPAYYATAGNVWDHDPIPTFLQPVATISDVEKTERVKDVSGRIQVNLAWDASNCDRASLRVRFRTTAKINDETYENIGVVFGTSYSFVVPEPGYIDVQLTPIPFNNKFLKGDTVSSTFRIYGIYSREPIALAPNVTGLKQLNKSINDTVFTGPDVQLEWNRVSTQQGSSFATYKPADYADPDSNFYNYRIQVYSSGTLRRTDYASSETYVYTQAMNYEDHSGAPSRNLRFEVYAAGTQSQQSSFPAIIEVSNPPPEAPTLLQIEGYTSNVAMDFKETTDNDRAGIIVWSSTTSGFTPVGTSPDDIGGNVVYRGVNDNIVISNLATATAHYFVAAAYDKFGVTELNKTSEFSAVTSSSFNKIQQVEVTLSATQQSTAHTLGVSPDMVIGVLECITADGIFAVGDVIPTGMTVDADEGSGASEQGLSLYANASNVYARYANKIRVINPTTGTAAFILDETKWKLKVTLITV